MDKITYELIDQYTCGDCWVLALMLSKVTGWEVAITNNIDHAFVISPDRTSALDVTGLISMRRFKADWVFEHPIIIGNYKEALDYFSNEDWGYYGDQIEWAQAEEIAVYLSELTKMAAA